MSFGDLVLGTLFDLLDKPLKLHNFLPLFSAHEVGVAGSAEASRIMLLVLVRTLRGISFSAVEVITVIAHPF